MKPCPSLVSGGRSISLKYETGMDEKTMPMKVPSAVPVGDRETECLRQARPANHHLGLEGAALQRVAQSFRLLDLQRPDAVSQLGEDEVDRLNRAVDLLRNDDCTHGTHFGHQSSRNTK